MSFCSLSRYRGIYTLTLSSSGDPQNYLTAEAIAELKDALEIVRGDRQARGLVTTSASGGSFCGGLKHNDNNNTLISDELEHGMAGVVRLLLDLPVPTAAAVCGDARSLGFALALAHDHCFAYVDAVLGFPAGGRIRVPGYAVALVREKIANARLRKLLVLGSRMCSGKELADQWYSVQGAASQPDKVVADAVRHLREVVVGHGVDYAKVRRTMYTHSCAAVAAATTTMASSTPLPNSSESPSAVVPVTTISLAMVPSGGSSSSSSTALSPISLHTIKTCTNSFSEDQKIGQGTFGVVYKAVYRGKEIAVKRLRQIYPIHSEDDDFRNELDHLMSVGHHPNIVRLVGYCYEIQNELYPVEGKPTFCQTIERIICFEYLPGSSLDKHLREGSSGLHDWTTCYKIIKGISEGLHYLHGLEKPIFHLDLKPANVLLDKNMVPKIADFGISKHFTGKQTHITPRPRGTLGYMAPEYFCGGKTSNKTDIFSLGAMVIDIMAWPKKRGSFTEMNSESFIGEVCNTWNERIGYQSREQDQVEKCIKMAITCVDEDRKNRPTISNIMDTLNQIKN